MFFCKRLWSGGGLGGPDKGTVVDNCGSKGLLW